MNRHEREAWRRLVEQGARELELGGKPALDVSRCRPRGLRGRRAQDWWSAFVGNVLAVAGNSGAVRRHVDRHGHPVFVVTDDPDPKRPFLPGD